MKTTRSQGESAARAVELVQFSVSAAEKDLFRRASRADGGNLTTWLRGLALARARELGLALPPPPAPAAGEGPR